MHSFRPLALAASCAIFVLASSPAAHAAESADKYPSRPIKFIVPHQPGGLVDQFARALGQHLNDTLGQPVIVENRPGANQAIGAANGRAGGPRRLYAFLRHANQPGVQHDHAQETQL